MEQRKYRGNLKPEELADALVSFYDPQENLQAQVIGEGQTLAIQIGRGDVEEDLRHAVTLAVSSNPDGEDGIAVTMGQQKWITPKLASFAAIMGLIGVMVTPWALFALIWPLSDALGSMTLPNDIWTTIDNYVISHGGELSDTQHLTHPHLNP